MPHSTLKRDVKVIFQTPEGDRLSHHERRFEDVPHSIAEQIAEDFVAAQDASKDTTPYQLYRYEGDDDERLIALDYTEVIAVTV